MRFQFSLRTLLILVTLFSVTCAYPLQWYRSLRREQTAVAHVTNQGGSVVYDYEVDGSPSVDGVPRAPGPRWLRHLLGSQCLAHVVYVDLGRYKDLTIENLGDLESFRHPRRLRAGGFTLSQDQMRRLQAKLPSLEVR